MPKAGASSAFYVMLRLPFELKDLFRDWLARLRRDPSNRLARLGVMATCVEAAALDDDGEVR